MLFENSDFRSPSQLFLSSRDPDPNTMMSRIHPNLYFVGEVLNVDGITGGFNFQHAWTSAWIAAKAIAGSGG
jgi:predicted flavoprotein YhiN